MQLTIVLLLSININLIILNNASSFDLTLNINGKNNYFRFFETITSIENLRMPSVIILDDNNDQSANITNSSFIQIYRIQFNENLFHIATVFSRTVSNSNLLFATIEMSNRSLYEIFPSISMSQTRSKRSFHYDYIVKHNGSILEQAFASIEWRNNRERRAAQKSRMKRKVEASNPFNEQSCVVGQHTEMSWKFSDIEKPQVTWWFSGQPLKTNSRFRVTENEDERSTITIHKTDFVDEDIYIARAYNSIGETEAKTILYIAGIKPVIEIDLETKLKVAKGRTITLKLTVSGIPQPEIVWMCDNNELISDDRVFITSPTRDTDSTYTLTIINVQLEDQGKYSANIKNIAGSLKSKNCEVIIISTLESGVARPVILMDDYHTNADNQHLEIFSLIWLDANPNVQELQGTQQKLCSIINQLKTFQDVEQCQNYIEGRTLKDRIVMIVSGQFGREIVPSIHKLRQVLSIYVYCMDKKSNKQWVSKFSKVKAVVVKHDELLSRIKTDHKIQRKLEEPVTINFFNTSTKAGKSTTAVNGQFVFSQVLIDCLLRLKSNEEDKTELINYCKHQYEGNNLELNNIREFEKDYVSGKVLWWYTKESFFYKTLNSALRTQNIHLIFLFRAFIFDIYRQLQNCQAKQPLQIYRSQMISSSELQTLTQCCDQFISVNSFFSTSTDKYQALSLLKIPEDVQNLEPILFEIDADPKLVTTKPFADITANSEFSGESEVLFMIGSIFCVKSIIRNNDYNVWIIKISLCSGNQHGLEEVLTNIKQKTAITETNLQTLGKILWEMGKLDLAEKYFTRRLKELPPDDSSLDNLYEDLAKLSSQTGNYDKSVYWHKKAVANSERHPLTVSVT
ncbi:unnamed protein product [Rotaria socialis]|uniref:Ig-like domain-containing protein n=1 Tax=Rotaria socialis TaxID=392032 RepID=A0A818N8A0_9BILA|nr:unnamed protein product [Rotaria socialis]CAF4448669.1 unnamed protein product [Rotaria socialis]